MLKDIAILEKKLSIAKANTERLENAVKELCKENELLKKPIDPVKAREILNIEDEVAEAVDCWLDGSYGQQYLFYKLAQIVKRHIDVGNE